MNIKNIGVKNKDAIIKIKDRLAGKKPGKAIIKEIESIKVIIFIVTSRIKLLVIVFIPSDLFILTFKNCILFPLKIFFINF